MSALVFLAPDANRRERPALAASLLDAAGGMAGPVRAVVDGDGWTAGMARHEWEMGSDFAGGALVLVDGDLVVLADASIYYRETLTGRLSAAGCSPTGGSASHLIAAAYRAWGVDCVRHLEGDYAFVVYDRGRHRTFAARDFAGTRPLHYALLRSQLVVATSMRSIRAHPDCSADFNLTELAAEISWFWAREDETIFRDIRALPAGHAFELAIGSSEPRVWRSWQPPEFAGESPSPVSFEDAAAELRELIERATVERMAAAGVTAMSLSGGWDSPAVFALGQASLRKRGLPPTLLHPVSLSYPEGDSGREDELISAIASFWQVEPSWVPISDAPMFRPVDEGGFDRDQPYAHPFTSGNRALAGAATALRARVMLTGLGGDHLFHAERAYLADMLRRGNLVGAAREWRAGGGGDRRELFLRMIGPLLGRRTRSLARRLRGGRPLPDYLGSTTLPPWINRDFAAAHGLEERQAAALPPRRGRDAEPYEREWMLLNGFFPRIVQAFYEVTARVGLEVRAPLFDDRIIRFAATRPRSERRSGTETKRLLREAMRGSVPDVHIASRSAKSGTLRDYFGTAMLREFATRSEPLFRSPILADLGIVDVDELRAAGARLERGLPEPYASAVLQTYYVELWLRDITSLGGTNVSAKRHDGGLSIHT